MNKFSKVLQKKLLEQYPKIEFKLEDDYYGEGSFRTKTDNMYMLYMLNNLSKSYELRVEPIDSFNKWSQAVYQQEIGKSNVDRILSEVKFISENIKTFSEMSNRYITYTTTDENFKEWYGELSRGFIEIRCARCGELVFIDELTDDLCLACEEEEETNG